MATENVGIVFTAQGLSQILSQTKELKNELSSLKNQRLDLLGNNEQLRRDLAEAVQKLNELKYAKQEAANVSGTKSREYKEAAADYAEAKKEVDNLRAALQASNLELGANSKAIEATNIELKEGAEAARDYASAIEAIGSAFSTLGNISGGIADFSTGIANSFQSMASMFNNVSVTDTLTRLATKYATEAFAGDLSSAISRYDILSTFVPYMEEAGVDEQTANSALARVNESIIGIPIGLDEAAQRLRRYQMFLGDVESATNLTIGAQNAIIAGGASEQMKNMAYMQIDRLLAAGKLNTSRQWLSLIQGLGVSMNYISEAMGTADMTSKELAAGLTSGEISTESFLEALMELGKGESEAAQGLNNLLTIYKGTVEAWQASIRYASTRGQANVIDALSDSLEKFTGQGVTAYMRDYRNFINEVYGGITGFITDNPMILVTSLEKFNQLIDAVTRFSASEFATNVFSRLGEGVDLISRALDHIPEGKLERFAAFATTLAGPIGTGMLASSGLGQILGIFERFEHFDFGMLVDDIAQNVQTMANVVSSVLGLIPDGFMSDLMAFGLVWGKPVATALQAIGSAFGSIAVAARTFTLTDAFSEGGLFAVLIKLGAAHPALAAAAAAIAAIGAGLAYFTASVNNKKADLMESLGLNNMEEDLRTADTLNASIERNTQARAENAEALAQQVQEAEQLRQHILDLNGQDLDASGLADLELSVERLNQIMPSAGAAIDETTGHLTAQSAAALEDAAAFEQLILQMQAAAQKTALMDIMSESASLNVQRAILVQDAHHANAVASEAWDNYYALYQDYQNGGGTGLDEVKAAWEVWQEAEDKTHDISAALRDNRDARQENNRQLEAAKKAYEETTAAMSEQNEELQNGEEYADAAAEAYENLATAQKELVKAADEAIDESTKKFLKKIDPFSKVTHPKGVSYSNDQTGVKSNNAWLQDFINDRQTVKEGIDKISEIDLTLPEGMTKADVVQGLQNYYANIMEGKPDEVMERVDQLAQMFSDGKWDELVQAAQNWKKNQELTVEATSADENPDFLGELQQLYSLDRINELKESMETYHQQIREILESTTQYTEPGEGKMPGGGVMALFDPGDPTGFTPEYAAKKIQAITQQMTDLGNQIAAAMQPIADAAQNVSQSTGEIGDAMGDLQESTGEAAEEVPANTDKMSSETSSHLSEMESNTDSSVTNTISSINELAPAIQSQILPVTVAAASLGSGLASGLQIGVSAAQNAASQIAAAAASIASAVQEANAAAASLGTGGGSEPVGEAVLLATGGSVFNPFGSDTVPAMLTPGEYIIRKGAADFFGRGLLERINALDIGGAFDRLILNSPVTAGRYGGNVYNKDSHASVTQNYYNSSPDYGRRRAMRFAHAL